MIKAVVVDDERLVRKGFISLIDWPSFGVVITGEAGDGNAALELLRQQETDLLFVDLTMPGMTGFELIRQVRLRFPAVRCVVLTCHHEFDYVQEALRLGAVDYIVKTLLEVENADETIRRLVERIRWEDGNRGALAPGELKVMSAGKALLYLPLEPEGNEADLFELSLVKNHPLISFQNLWLTPLPGRVPVDEIRRELGAVLGASWATALVEGVRDQPLKELEEVLERTVPQALFYDSGGDVLPSLNYVELKALAGRHRPAGAAEHGEPLVNARNLRWTLDRGAWDSFTAAVRSEQPRQEEVEGFGRELLRNWSRLLIKPDEAAELELAALRNRTWCQWKSWLRQFSGHVQQRMIELGLSKEVMFCLISAVDYMKSHAGDKINQGDVAAAINMSRGYFSQCFARFAGETFGDSLRSMRLELAKSLLRETHAPVCEIACRSGFEDDRYFSRLFREHVGKLPSEYRAEGMAER